MKSPMTRNLPSTIVLTDLPFYFNPHQNINTVLLYLKNNGVAIYTDFITLTNVCEKQEATYCRNSNFEEHTYDEEYQLDKILADGWQDTITGTVIIKSYSIYPPCLNCHTIMHTDKSLYCVDVTGLFVEPLSINLDKCYIKTNEADALFKPDKKEKAKSTINDQRYNFLVEWADINFPGTLPDQNFISTYDSSPTNNGTNQTKKSFYEILSLKYKTQYPSNDNIFISGSDSFYKDPRILLGFKVGRRRNK